MNTDEIRLDPELSPNDVEVIVSCDNPDCTNTSETTDICPYCGYCFVCTPEHPLCEDNMEARLASQEQQFTEDRVHIGTFGQYIPDEDIPGYPRHRLTSHPIECCCLICEPD